MALGIGLAAGGGVSIGLLAAIFISNLPETIGSATEMRAAGQTAPAIIPLWIAVPLICTLATVAGYPIADNASGDLQATINGFAAGALLAMLIDSMIRDAARQACEAAGLAHCLRLRRCRLALQRELNRHRYDRSGLTPGGAALRTRARTWPRGSSLPISRTTEYAGRAGTRAQIIGARPSGGRAWG